MSTKPTLTTESGAPVADNQHSQTAGPGGPTLLQDHYLIEKLARFNRERIPERVVHAVGTGAYGYLEVTSPEVPRWTKMRVFEHEPNSFNGPVQTSEERDRGLAVSGASGHYPRVAREVNDFMQAGDLYRLQPPDAQRRLVDNIAGSLAQVSREDIIDRAIGLFRKADAAFGQRIANGVTQRRGATAGAR